MYILATEVLLHIFEIKTNLLFVSENDIDQYIPVKELLILDYPPLMAKHGPQNLDGHGIGAFMKKR